jgi:hypothetical protein
VALRVVILETLLFVPFLFAGAAVGVALLDRGDRLGGHYAANLAGSGLGAVLAVALMFALDVAGLLRAMTIAGLLAAALATPWRRPGAAAATGLTAGLALLAAWAAPLDPVLSSYKTLPQALHMPGTRVLHRSHGPLGTIAAVEAPALHFAPGLGLEYVDPLPSHLHLIADGDHAAAVYDWRTPQDWRFMDHTTAAAAYHVKEKPDTLLVGAGGGADIGLALYNGCRRVTALEMNPQVIALMTGPLAERGGSIYRANGVTVLNREARGYMAAGGETFDLIQVPAVDAAGASSGGVRAAQESYLYTVQSFVSMLGRLRPDGALAVTRWSRTPPREELKAFDTAAEALRRLGLDPAGRLAMIRHWASATVLGSLRPWTADQVHRLRRFCDDRRFDLCYAPGTTAPEANRFHVLRDDLYFEACKSLVGPGRRDFLRRYLFDVEAATDDRPFFFHFLRWDAIPRLRQALGGQTPAFFEAGAMLLAAALGQAALLSVALLVAPLVPFAGGLKGARGRPATFAYFLLLGAGFTAMEMGFIQKFGLYLAHPIYSASAVIACFLVFSGLGSAASGRWPASGQGVILAAACATAVLAVLASAFLDGCLARTQAWPMALRLALAAAALAPLAFAMGHLFPAGLRLAGETSPALVPWAWAVNGCAGVVAASAAPLLAMSIGFRRLILAAAGCYALAALAGMALPAGARPAAATAASP